MPAPDTTPIDIIEREARATAASFGIACPGDLAAALVARIIKRIGGQKIYIPSETTAKAHRRAAMIRAQFTGANIAELARVHRITPRQVRNILAQSVRANLSKNSEAMGHDISAHLAKD